MEFLEIFAVFSENFAFIAVFRKFFDFILKYYS